MSELPRRTFAIISHPDAGKTTLTEQLLLYGGQVALAGTVKGRKASRHATSDWLALEQERGISVTTAVMQFPFQGCVFNLLDTPGHADFSEDTYRTLSAVDAALMVIDVAKGVEERTLKLMEVCRMRRTPIITFINKCDRHGKEPLELLEDIESSLGLKTIACTWPVGLGQELYGLTDGQSILRYQPSALGEKQTTTWQPLDETLDVEACLLDQALEEWALVQDPSLSATDVLEGRATPVYFGSALKSFAIEPLMEAIIRWAPPPHEAATLTRQVEAHEEPLTGFVFKVQANMDPKHRDRMAFMRICSGCYRPGVQLTQVRTGKKQTISQAQTFMAGQRQHTEEAHPGDIIGLYNHGGIRVGDTFTQGESLQFLGVPFFAPELFRRVQLRDPLKQKALLKGLMELAEEGATQFFRSHIGQNLIVGAIGVLQFDVVAYRLQREYQVQCTFESIPVQTARWLDGPSDKLEDFVAGNPQHVAKDSHEQWVYLAPSRVHLSLTQDRWPGIHFLSTYEPT